MKGLNLSGFKKIKEDAGSATMIHKDGHQIVVAKSALKPIQMKQLEKLPMHLAGGGEIAVNYDPNAPAYDPAKANAPTNLPNDQIQPGWVANPDPFAEMNGGPAAIPDPKQAHVEHPDIAVNYNPAAPEGQQFSSPPQSSQDQPAATAQQQGAQPAVMPDMNKGLQAQMAANNQLATAEGAQGQQTAAAIDKAQQQIAKLPTQQDIMAKYSDADSKFKQYIQDHPIDPKHFWADKTTNQKVAASIGLFLGGWSTAYTHGQNPALQIINNAIDKDIEAQKSNIGRNQSLWAMNRDAMKDDMGANLATKNQALASMQNEVAKVAALNQSPIAQARAQQLNSVIQQQMDQNNFKRSLIMGPTADNADPSTRVQFLVPAAHQQKAFDEIAAAQETAKNAQGILHAFDRAANNVHAADFVPGMDNVDQKALHALMGPTFKDVEGTVRQAAMDNMNKNTTPQFGDNKNTIQTKRNALIGYLTSKTAAPVAKGYGIDLSKFPSTDVHGAVQAVVRPVERVTQDGRIGMFNPATKQFMGYK